MGLPASNPVITLNEAEFRPLGITLRIHLWDVKWIVRGSSAWAKMAQFLGTPCAALSPTFAVACSWASSRTGPLAVLPVLQLHGALSMISAEDDWLTWAAVASGWTASG